MTHLPPSSAAASAVSPVLQIKPLGFPWDTLDPFLFCAYHDDAYPVANGQMGPTASLAGRQIGQDFSRQDGWSMYHGATVPGFPAHPHRGFETVTIVRKGLIDHSDSLGATARFGRGDVQWLTAGKGVVHAEMFPLLDTAAPNPLELFQIWLNLPAASKMVPPRFAMFWSQDVARVTTADSQGRETEVAVIAGRLGGAQAGAAEASHAEASTVEAGVVEADSAEAGVADAGVIEAGAAEAGAAEASAAETGAGEPLAPPPDSWAARQDADVAIWTIRMAPGAHWMLPAATGQGTRRQLYFFKGESVAMAGQSIAVSNAIELQADAAVELINGAQEGEFLLLQGRPIGEPVVQYGPFVMNTQAEIAQTFSDYRQTQFGGWPWTDSAPTHGRDPARFVRHPGGVEERPETGGDDQP
jgi:redox-sensitive bicupin YhaK (pirin superfamily)